jgi:hypothetical protein
VRRVKGRAKRLREKCSDEIGFPLGLRLLSVVLLSGAELSPKTFITELVVKMAAWCGGVLLKSYTKKGETGQC